MEYSWSMPRAGVHFINFDAGQGRICVIFKSHTYKHMVARDATQEVFCLEIRHSETKELILSIDEEGTVTFPGGMNISCNQWVQLFDEAWSLTVLHRNTERLMSPID